jgi:hypothetical protein
MTLGIVEFIGFNLRDRSGVDNAFGDKIRLLQIGEPLRSKGIEFVVVIA